MFASPSDAPVFSVSACTPSLTSQRSALNHKTSQKHITLFQSEKYEEVEGEREGQEELGIDPCVGMIVNMSRTKTPKIMTVLRIAGCLLST